MGAVPSWDYSHDMHCLQIKGLVDINEVDLTRSKLLDASPSGHDTCSALNTGKFPESAFPDVALAHGTSVGSQNFNDIVEPEGMTLVPLSRESKLPGLNGGTRPPKLLAMRAQLEELTQAVLLLLTQWKCYMTQQLGLGGRQIASIEMLQQAARKLADLSVAQVSAAVTLALATVILCTCTSQSVEYIKRMSTSFQAAMFIMFAPVTSKGSSRQRKHRQKDKESVCISSTSPPELVPFLCKC
jgi:hypothetical protein